MNFNAQAMSKFIAASKQATELDKTRLLLETRIKEVKEESKVWAEVAPRPGKRLKSSETLMKSSGRMSLRKIPVLTTSRKGTMSSIPFLKRRRRTQSRSSSRPSNLLTCWTRTTQLGSRTSGWTLWRTSPTLISAS